MEIITFSSPELDSDLTVSASAEQHRTLLQVARQHNLPIAFNCQEGQCGTCTVEVQILADAKPLGDHLTKREKKILKATGLVTKEQLQAAETEGMPPSWRLACQYRLGRDETILVKFY